MCLLKWSHAVRCLANEIKSLTLDGWVTLRLNYRLKGYAVGRADRLSMDH